ncbi:hypothetical protein G7074_10590 [Pedobacter sp. HDW13]|uniref:GIN domain-containing protein n=1 Tax=unclassified Pedobacter TaxID=2628915 RepID=UPI000F5904D8|nr:MULTISPECIES: DUF2807 domain-containing protein [unclassified Pedobacter]QIL39673.1 hypothetical protein G7074_10590 [Pedobacter sp. HDW13]RQO79847.1 hypothetical protein DBR40_02505 [Pedobacter sp. KBW01]
MKTSNKLLITLAALLIIIPIIVVAVNVKMNYRPSTGNDFVEEQVINAEPFDKVSQDKISIPIKSSFNAVNIPDAQRNGLELHFIKSTVTGVKIPADMKENINVSVNSEGILQINFDSKESKSVSHRYEVVILIYSPNVDKLNLNNSANLTLTAKTDSLSINIKNSGLLTFGSPITFSSNGKINRVINQTEIKNLNINLDSATFNSGNNNYKNLNIICKNSSVNIESEEKENKNIENLTINTFEKSEIKIDKVKIDKISGSLSDETTIAMPVKYLKQMLKD